MKFKVVKLIEVKNRMGRDMRKLEMFRDLIWVAVTCVGTYVEIHSIHISFVYYTEFIPQKQKVFFLKKKSVS